MPSGRCCGWWNDWEQPRSSATLPARSRHHHPGIASSSKAPPAPPTHLATADNGTARGAREASTAGPNPRFELLRRRPRADDRGPHGGAPSAVDSGLELGPNQSARVIRRGSLQHRCIVVPRCISSLGMSLKFQNSMQNNLVSENKTTSFSVSTMHANTSNFGSKTWNSPIPQRQAKDNLCPKVVHRNCLISSFIFCILGNRCNTSV